MLEKSRRVRAIRSTHYYKKGAEGAIVDFDYSNKPYKPRVLFDSGEYLTLGDNVQETWTVPQEHFEFINALPKLSSLEREILKNVNEQWCWIINTHGFIWLLDIKPFKDSDYEWYGEGEEEQFDFSSLSNIIDEEPFRNLPTGIPYRISELINEEEN